MSMRSDISDSLDAIDELAPGEGRLDLFGFGRGDFDSGSLGFGLDYGHRINTNWSAYAAAEAGYYYGEESGLGFDVRAGLRGKFR